MPVAQNNLGISYQNGDGVTKNIDEAANWFYCALENGYFEAKEKLDDIFDQTEKFKLKHPEYKKWDKSYGEFLNQEIILL